MNICDTLLIITVDLSFHTGDLVSVMHRPIPMLTVAVNAVVVQLVARAKLCTGQNGFVTRIKSHGRWCGLCLLHATAVRDKLGVGFGHEPLVFPCGWRVLFNRLVILHFVFLQ